ncbi:MAG: ATP-binding cassette domain-containing protein [Chitinophagaceae bacterium]|jgi:ABC-2 type transport system ATP-binding protein|nr:ATP-binding cassette domain-containing protein [Chitinophagaceae bacterium]
MSVRVENLTKVYGEQTVVDAISFTIKKGEIVGFLGPNGAGKSTTMKMITGYIPVTAGKAFVCDDEVATNVLNTQRRIGYLPESNPLYMEMYVKEYLSFLASVHHVADAEKKINDIIEHTGLKVEEKKKIGALSKGYKQRVGIAQAMLHNPEVLILDEPTSGLDPNQIIEIRDLIKKFGKEKTIILSTHIMQEVEAMCDRVIIINKGKIVADDTLIGLQNQHPNKTLEDIFRELTVL